MRLIVFGVMGVALVGGNTGCESGSIVPIPEFDFYATPSAEIDDVVLREVSPTSASAVVIVTLSNPNDDPMPLKLASYRVALGGDVFRGTAPANATIPANGSVQIELGAAVETSDFDSSYQASGTVEYQPPGEFRQLMLDFGVPLPTIAFSDYGEVTNRAVRLERADIDAPSKSWDEPRPVLPIE